MRDFWLILLFLGVLRLIIPRVGIPLAVLPFVNIILTIIFLALPVIAIYRAMSDNPNSKQAFYLFIIGVAIQALAITTDLYVLRQQPTLSSLIEPLKPTGLQIWCIGLGAMVAALVKDKNLLIPIGIFLIGYDIFLVLTPLGFTQKIMQAAPGILQQGGLSLPKASVEVATTGKAQYSGIIGPADLVFMGTFFLAMFRFNMRALTTLRIMIPVLLGYLVFVLATGISLPALVPIGLVSLLVNWREFKLTKDEWGGTAVVVLLVLGILIFSATRPRPAPGQKVPSQVSPKPATSPAPNGPGQSRSEPPNAPQSTPSPR
jgi:hypothetical protein